MTTTELYDLAARNTPRVRVTNAQGICAALTAAPIAAAGIMWAVMPAAALLALGIGAGASLAILAMLILIGWTARYQRTTAVMVAPTPDTAPALPAAA